MGKGEEIEHAVVLGDRHTAPVGFQGSNILSVGKHHSLAVARRTAGVKDVCQICG